LRPRSRGTDTALSEFLRRVWREDVAPLLRGRRAEQRRKAARMGGRVAAAGGLLVDTVFRLRGKPFTRFMTVMGARLGAMAPDVWDWKWFSRADRAVREEVTRQVQRRAAELAEAEARALLGVGARADGEAIKHAWREAARRWHPDKAADDMQRAEYRLKFIAYQAAYARLTERAQEGGA
jgi:DnaJ-domain-containing protein 1